MLEPGVGDVLVSRHARRELAYPLSRRRVIEDDDAALLKYPSNMFGALRKRFARASRASTARNAAEGTYEALRHAVIFAQPSSQAEAEHLLLEALSRRRSWRRLNAQEFQCTWFRRTARIAVPEPFDATALLRLIVDAEVSVFAGDAPETELPELYAIARLELQRLLDRDSLPLQR